MLEYPQTGIEDHYQAQLQDRFLLLKTERQPQCHHVLEDGSLPVQLTYRLADIWNRDGSCREHRIVTAVCTSGAWPLAGYRQVV